MRSLKQRRRISIVRLNKQNVDYNNLLMRFSFKTIIVTVLISVTLLFVGFFSWDKIFDLLLPNVEEVKYLSTSFTESFRQILVFSLTLALIPISSILIWRFAPIISIKKKILTIVIIFVSIVFFIAIRREMIKYYARHLEPTSVIDHFDTSDNPQFKKTENRIPVSTLIFEWYAFAGLITGSFISIVSLRAKAKWCISQ